MEARVQCGVWAATASASDGCREPRRSATGDRASQEAIWSARERPGSELLRGGTGRLLAAPLPGGGGGREPGGGLFEHRGQSAFSSGEDRRDGCGEAAGSADAVRAGREEGVARGAGACGGSGGPPAVSSGAGGPEGGEDPAHQSDQGAAGRPGGEAGDRGEFPGAAEGKSGCGRAADAGGAEGQAGEGV